MRKRIRTGDIFVICACEEDGCALYGEEKGINPDDFFVAGVPICSECGEDLQIRSKNKPVGANLVFTLYSQK